MSDLVEFLRARLDEDERIAKARADGADWMDFEPCRNTHHPHAEYLPHFAPYRMLAEVESKRRIIDLHASANGDGSGGCSTCTDSDYIGLLPLGQGWPCKTLGLLAQSYADHPDYEESWRVG